MPFVSTRAVGARRALASAALCVAATAHAGGDAGPKPRQEGACPLHPGAAVTQIDLFDGDPSDEAQLAPDSDDDRRHVVYSLQSIYDDGRYVTLRCHYGRTAVEDIKLTKPVARCVYSEERGRPVLRCG